MVRILTLFLCLLAAPASGQMRLVDLEEVVEIKVREGWRARDGRHFAGLEVRLAEGWKTYWRSPGATGIAPRVRWSGSRNIEEVVLHWPTPSAFLTAGYPSLGYTQDFILPFEVHTRDPGAPITVNAEIEIGVCLDICLPAKVTVRAELPPSGAQDSAIAAALQDKPRDGRGSVTCTLRPLAEGVLLEAEIPYTRPFGVAQVVAVEVLNAQDRLWITDTEMERTESVLRTRTEFMHPDDRPVSIARSGLRFTVVGTRGAVEYFGCISP